MMFFDDYEFNFWGWWVLALIFLGLEILAPGIFFLWLGIAAAIVGLIVLVIADLTVPVQFVLFAIFAIASVVAGRRIFRRVQTVAEGSPLNERASQYIGHVFTLIQPMENGEGKVKIGDSSWIVAGAFTAAAGEQVRVTGVNGVVLTVEKV